LEELQKMSIPGLDTWLQSPQGRYVMAWEQASIDAVVADLFGYHALQLGLPQRELLLHNRIPLRQVAATQAGSTSSATCGNCPSPRTASIWW
jgi:hypothetical protein